MRKEDLWETSVQNNRNLIAQELLVKFGIDLTNLPTYRQVGTLKFSELTIFFITIH